MFGTYLRFEIELYLQGGPNNILSTLACTVALWLKACTVALWLKACTLEGGCSYASPPGFGLSAIFAVCFDLYFVRTSLEVKLPTFKESRQLARPRRRIRA